MSIPLGTTHIDETLGAARFWIIPPAGQEDGTGSFFNGFEWVTSEISGAFVDKLKPVAAPLRVVVDISGGALHGVYATVPVEVLFISDDSDDIASQRETLHDSEMYVDNDGQIVAAWVMSSTGGRDADIVEHFFSQQSEGKV